jgi:hypothetical protein
MDGVAMPNFTIDSDNNITALLKAPADPTNTFASEKDLAKLAADWPAPRFIECWNSFAGVAPFDDLKPVKKFTDRKAAVARIWKAVTRLSPDVAPQAAHVAPVKAKAKEAPAKGKRRDGAHTGANVRQGSKKANVLALLGRKEGATLAQLMKAAGWQAHSVRGFLSGALGKKMRLKVESTKSDAGDRIYSLGK